MIHLYLSTISKAEIIEEFLVGFLFVCFSSRERKGSKEEKQVGRRMGSPQYGQIQSLKEDKSN